MDKHEFLKIIDKYLIGESTEAEGQLLKKYLDSFQANRQWNETELGNQQDEEALLYEKLKMAMGQQNAPPVNIYQSRRYLWLAAAMVILIVGVSFLFHFNSYKKESPVTAGVGLAKGQNDLLPGGNRAVLTLANGVSIELDSAKNGRLSKQGNADVLKLKDGEIAYNHGAANNGIAVVYNAISTPKGGQYHVILSDGTQVWLNAASSIHFPTSFTEKQRQVEITGEVYFEVAKNREKPFIVKANGTEVEVLGTQFNVNAYSEEADIKTTLLEGAVKIIKGNSSSVLKPGEQAVVDNNKKTISLKTTVDLEEVMAWKDGWFKFNSADIPFIMREIARWYNVEVVYEGNIPTDHFTGKIPRNARASSVLKILSMSDEHFRIEDKRIIVTSK